MRLDGRGGFGVGVTCPVPTSVASAQDEPYAIVVGATDVYWTTFAPSKREVLKYAK